jgi:hypothetical protein
MTPPRDARRPRRPEVDLAAAVFSLRQPSGPQLRERLAQLQRLQMLPQRRQEKEKFSAPGGRATAMSPLPRGSPWRAGRPPPPLWRRGGPLGWGIARMEDTLLLNQLLVSQQPGRWHRQRPRLVNASPCGARSPRWSTQRQAVGRREPASQALEATRRLLALQAAGTAPTSRPSSWRQPCGPPLAGRLAPTGGGSNSRRTHRSLPRTEFDFGCSGPSG